MKDLPYADKIELLKKAYQEALKSPDPSSQNGAVSCDSSGRVIGRGCNEFPPGVPPRLVSPEKYLYIQHAERNAIYNSKMRAEILVCPWIACSECAKTIVCGGVRRVITHKQRMDLTASHWSESVNAGLTMLADAGVQVEYIDHVFNIDPILVIGVLWTP